MSQTPPSNSAASQNTFKGKLDHLWATNKIMFIGIIAFITLIIFSAIFCIVYFLVIKPRQAQADSTVHPASTPPKVSHDID